MGFDFKKRFWTLDVDSEPRPGNWWDAGFLFGDKDLRTVGDTYIGHVRISTVFLVIDHSYSTVFDEDFEAPKPVLFETMVFGGRYDECQWRYHTRAEAAKGHCKVVGMVALALARDLFLGRWAVLLYSTALVLLVAYLNGNDYQR